MISKGGHDAGDTFCILEYRSVKMGIPWTDNPFLTRTFDIRPLNDSFRSDELRTEWMLKLEEAVGGSMDWDHERQKRFIKYIIVETVKQIVAELPGLTDAVREQCRSVTDLASARDAATTARDAATTARDAARAYATATAAYATATAASEAAVYAARATAAAARAAAAAAAAHAEADAVLIIACKIWIKGASL